MTRSSKSHFSPFHSLVSTSYSRSRTVEYVLEAETVSDTGTCDHALERECTDNLGDRAEQNRRDGEGERRLVS